MIDLGHQDADMLLAHLVIVDVHRRAVPFQRLARGVAQQGRSAEMPSIAFADDPQTMLHLVRLAGVTRFQPRGDGRSPILRMDDALPIGAAEADFAVFLAVRIGVVDSAVRPSGPHQLRQAVGEKAKSLFTQAPLSFGELSLDRALVKQRRSFGKGVRQFIEFANACRIDGDGFALADVLGRRLQQAHAKGEPPIG